MDRFSVAADEILSLRGKRIFFASTACLALRHEDALLSSHLRASNTIASAPDEADIIVMSTCGITAEIAQHSIRDAYALAASQPSARIYLGGCMPESEAFFGDPSERIFSFDTKGLYAFFQQQSAVGLPGDSAVEFRPYWRPKLRDQIEVSRRLFTISPDLAQAYVYCTDGLYFVNEVCPPARLRIATGCNHHCTFCSIPATRGSHQSVALELILRSIRERAGRNDKKFVLISDNLGQFGTDRGRHYPNLVRLLEMMLEIDSGLRFALRYLGPDDLLRFADPLLHYCESGNIYFIGTPLQSASPGLLRRMGRSAATDRVSALLHRLRRIDGLFLGTTMINGFPGETGEDHRRSLAFLREHELDVTAAVPFSERKNTRAAAMAECVPPEVRRDRNDEMNAVIQEVRERRLRHYLDQFCGAEMAQAEKEAVVELVLRF